MYDSDEIHGFYGQPDDTSDALIFNDEVRRIIEGAEDKIGQSFVDAQDQPFVKHAGKFWNIVAVSLDGNYCVILYTKGRRTVHKIILTEEAIDYTRQAARQEILMSRRNFFGALALVMGGASKVSYDWEKSKKPKPLP